MSTALRVKLLSEVVFYLLSTKRTLSGQRLLCTSAAALVSFQVNSCKHTAVCIQMAPLFFCFFFYCALAELLLSLFASLEEIMWRHPILAFFFCYSCQIKKKKRHSKHLEFVCCWVLALAVYTLLWKIKAVCWSESCSTYYKMLISKPACYLSASGFVFCPILFISVRTVPPWGGSVVQHQFSQCTMRRAIHTIAAVLSVLTARARSFLRRALSFLSSFNPQLLFVLVVTDYQSRSWQSAVKGLKKNVLRSLKRGQITPGSQIQFTREVLRSSKVH